MTTLTRSPEEAGVDHGVGLVDAAVDGGDDALDGLHQLLGGGEAHGQPFEAAVPLHVHLVGAVDHDLADGGVLQERFEDAEAERLVDDAADEVGPLGGGQDGALAADDVAEDPFQAHAAVGGREGGHLREVDLLQELAAVGADEVVLLAVLPPAGSEPVMRARRLMGSLLRWS